MPELNLFGISQYGKSLNVTAQDRLNCYLEIQAGDDRAKVAIYGTPGLDLFSTFGETPIRGIYQRTDLLYVVHRGTFYEVNNSGIATAKGMIGTTSGKVYMWDNGTQLMLTDGAYGYIYMFDLTIHNISTITNVTTLATLTTDTPHGLYTGMTITVSGATASAYNGTFAITVISQTQFTYIMASDPGGSASVVGTYTANKFQQITDSDYPGAATVSWQDGYFVVNPPNSSTFYVSDIGNGFAWDALDFASAESNPDNIISVWSDNSTLYLFGSVSTEFWTNSGAADFPFSRISGGSTEWGCAAVNSICKYDNTLAFLAKNRMGEVIVAKMAGNLPQRISNPELEHIINNYSAISDCSTFAYMLGGHPMLQVNFPTAGASWLYDGLSNCWSRVQSKGIGRHRAEMGVNYLDKIMVTDFENGNLYRLNPNSVTDNGEEIAFEITSRHLSQDDRRIIVDKVQLDMETGVGTISGQGVNPQVMLSISKDNGHTYGTEQWCDLGNIGAFRQRAIWRRLGQSRDWVFKWRITDPVKRVILGASVNFRTNGT